MTGENNIKPDTPDNNEFQKEAGQTLKSGQHRDTMKSTTVDTASMRDHENSDTIQSKENYFADDQTLATGFFDSIIAGLENDDAEQIKALFEKLHPADQADLLGLCNDEQRLLLIKLLDGEINSATFAELEDDIVTDVVDALSTEVVAEAVSELDTDDAVSVLEDVDEVKRAEILAEVPVADRIAVRAALDFKEDSAGRMMQRDVFAVPAYWTVGQIIDRLREESGLPERFYEVFVIDPTFSPVGTVALSTLIKSPRDSIINTLMTEPLRSIPTAMDQEEVAYLFEQYNLISAAVIDEDERLVGMITVDDVVEIIHEETHEDMLALAGVEADTGLSDTVFETVRSRISWLSINLFTAILASLIIWPFSGIIAAFVPLAVLMPIVASMGGNAGTQTLTVAVRSLATKDITASNAKRIILREALVGLSNGFVFALIMGILAGVWYYFSIEQIASTAALLASVVAIAMIINLMAAGLAGILIPIGLQRAGYDPAVSSAVFVTTVTDILGFLVFLGLASVVMTTVI